MTNARPVGWGDIATQRPGERTNMVVIVCGQGDERLFDPTQGKPDMLVTFVVLKEIGEVPAPAPARASRKCVASPIYSSPHRTATMSAT